MLLSTLCIVHSTSRSSSNHKCIETRLVHMYVRQSVAGGRWARHLAPFFFNSFRFRSLSWILFIYMAKCCLSIRLLSFPSRQPLPCLPGPLHLFPYIYLNLWPRLAALALIKHLATLSGVSWICEKVPGMPATKGNCLARLQTKDMRQKRNVKKEIVRLMVIARLNEAAIGCRAGSFWLLKYLKGFLFLPICLFLPCPSSYSVRRTIWD